MIRQSSSNAVSTLLGCPRFVRTKDNIRKAKYRLRRKKGVSARKRWMELGISDKSVRRIMKNDLGLHSYKILIESLPSDDQKIKRKQFANWIRTNFRKEDTMNILVSVEKFFDTDGIYNSQNDWVWVVSRADADEKVAFSKDKNFHRK